MPTWRFTSIVPETDESVVAVVSDGDRSHRYRITTAPAVAWPLRSRRPDGSPPQSLTALNFTPLDRGTPPTARPLTAQAIRLKRLWQLMLSLSAAGCVVSPFIHGFARAYFAWPIALLCVAGATTPIRGRTLPGWVGWWNDQIGSRDPAARRRPVEEALAALRR